MKPSKFLLLLPSLLAAAGAVRAEVVERVIVKVNGDIVTLTDFEARQLATVQAARIGPAGVEAFLRDNNARILQEAIDDLLLVQRAADLGIKLRPDYIREVVESIKKENHIESDQALLEQLRHEAMTLDDLKRNIERSILRRQVLARELDPRTVVTEAEVRGDYDAHRSEHARPATLRLQEIVVKGGEEAAALARSLAERAQQGEDFQALAREHSKAPTREAGGDLGRLALSDLSPDIARAVRELPAGAVSAPVPTAGGYRLLKVVERTEAAAVPYEEVRAEIERRLQAQKAARETTQYLEGLRKNAIIDVRVREVPLQLQAAPGAGSLLEPPAVEPPPPAAPPPGSPGEPEVTTTPQDKPEHVAPAAAPPGRAPEPKKDRKDEPPPPPPGS